MNAIAFDTHAFVKRLTAAGMPESQAEILADEQRRLIDDRLTTKDDLARSDSATKTEFVRLEAATKAEFVRVEATTKSEFALVRRDIEVMKHELTIRLGGMIMALGGVLVAIKFLGH